MVGHHVIQRFFNVDKYVQEDIDMNKTKKAFAAMNALFDLLDNTASTLTTAFDSATGEHLIRLEYRVKGPIDLDTDQRRFDNGHDGQSILQSMLALT